MLDEPASGLDVGQAKDLVGLLRTLADLGLAMLLIEHDMSVVMDVCEYITVLDFGIVIAGGTPEEIQHNQDVLDAYLGRPHRCLRSTASPSHYGLARALYGVDLRVDDGEIVALIGPNGAGKTTALNAIGGLLPREGDVHLRRRAAAHPWRGVVDRGVALVPQGRQVFPSMTRRGEPAPRRVLPRAPTGGGRTSGSHRSSSTSPAWRNGGANRPASCPAASSRCWSSAGRCCPTAIVLIDELSLGLAPKLVRTLLEMIVRLNSEQGTAFLLVEQAAAAALEVSGCAYLLQKGRVVQSGPAEDLRGDVDALRRAYLGHPAEASSSAMGGDRRA